jgi:hypothetical protein
LLKEVEADGFAFQSRCNDLARLDGARMSVYGLDSVAAAYAGTGERPEWRESDFAPRKKKIAVHKFFITSLVGRPAPFISTSHNFGQNRPGSIHNFDRPIVFSRQKGAMFYSQVRLWLCSLGITD